MELTEIYDSNGLDGVDNKNEWDKLPNRLKYFISSTQNEILEKVKRNVLEKYGQNGIKSLRKTSGWRSSGANKRNNGVSNSLHLYGLAIDFAKDGVFKTTPIPVCCSLQCIDSGKCWHIQFKRGV